MIVSTDIDEPGAQPAGTDGAATSSSGLWSRALSVLKLFLSAEHRCVPPTTATRWTLAASDSRAPGTYVCPECGSHWRREA